MNFSIKIMIFSSVVVEQFGDERKMLLDRFQAIDVVVGRGIHGEGAREVGDHRKNARKIYSYVVCGNEVEVGFKVELY